MALATSEGSENAPRPSADWESFYANYRKPGYIPGFEIKGKLGGGVFGIVFKACRQSIGKDYAIKFLQVDDAVVRDAVFKELDAVRWFAQIDHPNLVAIEDQGVVDGIPYIVMGFAGQETLRTRLGDGALGQDAALPIFIQAARGVQALHAHSLVHFNLKPANIFLKGDIARVGDYGLSKLVQGSRNSLSFGRGTPYYMAPELLQRKGDARSDIYSLGIILYECLTGEVPFQGDSEWEVLRKHETADAEFPPQVPDHLAEVIRRCIAKAPSDRYASVGDLLRALQAPVALGESIAFTTSPGARRSADHDASAGPVGAPPPIPTAGSATTTAGIGETPTEETLRGMPWRDRPRRRKNPIAWVVESVFRGLAALLHGVFVPVRMLLVGLGQFLGWLIALPFRILGALAWVIGYAVIILAMVALVLALFGVAF